VDVPQNIILAIINANKIIKDFMGDMIIKRNPKIVAYLWINDEYGLR